LEYTLCFVDRRDDYLDIPCPSSDVVITRWKGDAIALLTPEKFDEVTEYLKGVPNSRIKNMLQRWIIAGATIVEYKKEKGLDAAIWLKNLYPDINEWIYVKAEQDDLPFGYIIPH